MADGPSGLRAALRAGRGRRIAAWVLLAVGLFCTGLTLLAFAAAVRDDYAIDHHLGRADADVLSVGYQRTVISFGTPDGAVHVPVTGVLYPRRLEQGMRVRVEYDSTDPDLVRVAGRDWHLALLPTGTTLLFIWVVAAPGAYLLRRGLPRRRTRDSPAPAEHLVGDAGRGDE